MEGKVGRAESPFAAALGPQIVTNSHKLICGDMCRFVDGVSGWSWEWVSGGLEELFFNRVERVETCRTGKFLG